MRDLINELMDYGKSLGAEFLDIRVQRLHDSRIVARNDIIEVMRLSSARGAGIRVLVNGVWGFASTSSLDKETLKEAIKNAVSMAKGAQSLVRRRTVLAEVDIVEDKVTARVEIDPQNVPPEEKVEYVLEVNKNILDFDKRIKSAQSSYGDARIHQIYASSEGAYIEQEKVYVFFSSDAAAIENGIRASAREYYGSTKGYSIVKEHPPDEFAKILGERLQKQLIAKTPRGGAFPVIIAPRVIGLFTHEAFGHLSEADLAFSGAVTIQKIGQKVASELVTIIDDGTLPDGFGTFAYDDEGVKTQKTVVVKEGILVSFLYDREMAKAFEMMLRQRAPNVLEYFNVKPTGNARAENYRVNPIIRMRNTYIAPGDNSVDELFEDITFGYYLVAPLGGQANIDGTFQGGIQEAYEIVNRDIGDPVRNVSFSGNTLETLMKIDSVAKDFEIRAGACGKGQAAYVGLGGPHVRVKELVLGGGV